MAVEDDGLQANRELVPVRQKVYEALDVAFLQRVPIALGGSASLECRVPVGDGMTRGQLLVVLLLDDPVLDFGGDLAAHCLSLGPGMPAVEGGPPPGTRRSL
jgi:hypothetical protein